MKTKHAWNSFPGAMFVAVQQKRAVRRHAGAFPRFFAVVTLVALGLMFTATGAKAGCADPTKAKTVVPAPLFEGQQENTPNQPVTIVGLWHAVYTATYANGFPPGAPPPPFQFIQSYKTWHGDGTEFENAFLPPTGGNVCFGVWEDVGPGTVQLHHIGLMFNPDNGAVSNVFTVDELDIVAPNGKTYVGRFVFRLFGPADVLGTGTPIGEVKGTIAATRITIPSAAALE
jgi:hypothetical protein